MLLTVCLEAKRFMISQKNAPAETQSQDRHLVARRCHMNGNVLLEGICVACAMVGGARVFKVDFTFSFLLLFPVCLTYLYIYFAEAWFDVNK